jgi:hypothetical protein
VEKGAEASHDHRAPVAGKRLLQAVLHYCVPTPLAEWKQCEVVCGEGHDVDDLSTQCPDLIAAAVAEKDALLEPPAVILTAGGHIAEATGSGNVVRSDPEIGRWKGHRKGRAVNREGR